MTKPIAISLDEKEREKERSEELLKGNIPCQKKSDYNDITAWLMACLSQLAYIKFNNPSRSSLSGNKPLKTQLEILKMELETTFDYDGTQAILVSYKDSSKKFIVLAFRGIERDSMRDIKTGVKAKITTEEDGRIHTGFKKAFEAVRLEIEEYLEKGKENEEAIQNWPLFITGHNLGGALATIAAKRLRTRGVIPACYTFGSPRVGDDKWITGIDSPIYRIVNAADCVPNLPPGTTSITILRELARLLPYIGKPINAYIAKFGGYLHGGDMRYLTNCAKGAYNDVELLNHVNWLYRIKAFPAGKLPFMKIIADHGIDVYRRKLMVIAERQRQKK